MCDIGLPPAPPQPVSPRPAPSARLLQREGHVWGGQLLGFGGRWLLKRDSPLLTDAESPVRLLPGSENRHKEEPGFRGPETETWKDRGCDLHAAAACTPYPCFSPQVVGDVQPASQATTSASSPDTLLCFSLPWTHTVFGVTRFRFSG